MESFKSMVDKTELLQQLMARVTWQMTSIISLLAIVNYRNIFTIHVNIILITTFYFIELVGILKQYK